MKNNQYYYLKKGWQNNIPIYQYMDLDYLFSLLESKHYYVNRKCHFEDKGEYVSRRYLGIQNLSPTSITPKVIINTLGVIFNTFGLISFSPRQIMTSTHDHTIIYLLVCLFKMAESK